MSSSTEKLGRVEVRLLIESRPTTEGAIDGARLSGAKDEGLDGPGVFGLDIQTPSTWTPCCRALTPKGTSTVSFMIALASRS